MDTAKTKLLNWISNSTDMSLFNFPDTFVYFLFVWKTKIFFFSSRFSLWLFSIYVYTEHFVSSELIQLMRHSRGAGAHTAQSAQIYSNTRNEKCSSLNFRKKKNLERRNYWKIFFDFFFLFRFQFPMIWDESEWGVGGGGGNRRSTNLIVDVLCFTSAHIVSCFLMFIVSMSMMIEKQIS